jgi:hypothetical protein
MPCRGAERMIFYKEKGNCSISTPQGKTGENIFLDNIPFAEQEQELKFYFESNFRNLQENNTSINEQINVIEFYPYVDMSKQMEACQIYEDFDQIILGVIVAVPLIYLSISIALICYCVKLRNISNQYHQLVEDGSSTDTSMRKYNQQLELGSSVNMSKKNNPA